MVSGPDGVIPPTGTLESIFDEVSKQENIAGTTDYRCIYLENSRNSVEPAVAPRVRILSETESEISLGPLQKNVQAEAIANEKTAPQAVTFRTQKEIDEQNSDKYLRFPDVTSLLPGEYCGLWLKRKTKPTSGAGTITEEVILDINWDE